ncbi:MAG: RNA-binding transcriptional accessory protein [Marinilabiliales bacterium]|nr:MAG: RNA-binding transcriptional accessory protein [Marinilabiliales bacterium]
MILFTEKIASAININEWQVKNALDLLNGGATIPFIARYRKEQTGELTDIQLIEIDKLYKILVALAERKEAILKSLKERNLLTSELENKIINSQTQTELEDVYLPFKPKRKTRATIAIDKGLEPLAKMIMSENVSSLDAVARKYISEKQEVNSTEDALQGARDIIAEWISEKDFVRNYIRGQFQRSAEIISKQNKKNSDDGNKYESYYDWQEKAGRAPAHRLLAMFRGENEGLLKLKILPDIDFVYSHLENKIIRNNNEAADQKKIALIDSIKRLLFPSLETEYRKELKQKADESSIKVFAENLKQLLLAPPLGQKNILAIDPGFRTGCKVVCLDSNGNLLNNETIYPHPPQNQSLAAMKKINSLVNAYKIDAIAIGNGTAGRETENLIKRIRFNNEVIAVMVSENGASVYSASAIARKEFPDYDVTVRGAVSIGRRLQDPLAELVKIDPKAIGVGQYQHDVDQKLLSESLKTTVELCVNTVGVDLNLASAELLSYVSGIGSSLAENIVEHRLANGNFSSREQLKEIKGLGHKAFEQSAGFLKIKNADNPLDASAVHPESYHIVEKMAGSINCKSEDLIANKKNIEKIKISNFVDVNTGLPSLKDIISELEKPGRDPRSAHKIFEFDASLKTINDLRVGTIVPGMVTNITDFGAFVDIGIKENGLLHKSQIADEYISNPSEHLFMNQQLRVKVLSVDIEKKRISLSLRY